MEATPDNRETISVEAKKFTFFQSRGGFVFKEVHQRWDRELFLTENQSKWIQEGLFHRSQRFGETRRKESKNIDGRMVVITEGSNQKGCFISIHFKGNREDSKFLIIPSGSKGLHWKRVSKLIGNSWLNHGKQSESHRKASSDNISVSSDRSGKSSAKAFCRSQEKEESYVVNLLINRVEMLEKEVSILLQRKVQDLEKEIRHLRSQATESCSIVGFRTEAHTGEGGGVPSERVHHDAPAAVAANPGIPAKKMIHLTDDIRSDPTAGNTLSNSCVPELNVLCARFFEELAKHFQQLHSGDNNHSNAETDSNVIWDKLSSSKGINEVNSSTQYFHSHNAPSSDMVSKVNAGIPANGSEFGSASSAMHGQGSLTASATNSEDDKWGDDSSSTENDEIFWDDKYDCYAHSSGMRYEQQTNTYFAEASSAPDDLSCFYFVPKRGKLVLAYKGKFGDINREVMSDKGWDWTVVTNSLCFPPNLLELFRRKLVDIELSGM